MAKVTITNTAPGLRGVNTDEGLVYLAPGETRDDLDVSGGNLKAARAKSYFTFDGRVDESSDAEPQGDGLDDMSVADLDSLIAAEGVTLPETGTGNNGNVVKADRVAAIRAHRASPSESADDLDAMSDDDLRVTVQALTGKEMGELADFDRETLLGLARAV